MVTENGGVLLAALDELGVSAHNTITVGDAENDLVLLRAAEVGAAVANAVPSLAARADLRLSGPDGQGVAELLAGPLITGDQRLCPRRRWLHVGAFAGGEPVLVPGSHASILIAGDPVACHSYLAGVLAERWIDAGYAVAEPGTCAITRRPGITSAGFRHGADLTLTVDGQPPAAAGLSAPVARAAISIGGQPSRPFSVAPRQGARARWRSAPGRAV